MLLTLELKAGFISDLKQICFTNTGVRFAISADEFTARILKETYVSRMRSLAINISSWELVPNLKSTHRNH